MMASMTADDYYGKPAVGQPVAWTTLVAWHRNEVSFTFPRQSDVEARYRERLARETPADVAARIRRDHLTHAPWCLLLNEYPYHCEPGVTHYVFWMRDKLSYDEVDRILVTECDEIPNDRRKIVVLENARTVKSIPGLEHYHVFVLADDRYMGANAQDDNGDDADGDTDSSGDESNGTEDEATQVDPAYAEDGARGG